MITLPSAEYHAQTDYVSKSMLDKIRRAPAVLKAYIDGLQQKQTPAMAMGTAAHAETLEQSVSAPEEGTASTLFEATLRAAVAEPGSVIVSPKFDRRTKAGKADHEAFHASIAGKGLTVVDDETYQRVKAMREAVMAHPVAARIFESGVAERSVFAELEGVKVKCRPDWYRPDIALAADLKSTTDASPKGFAKSVANFRYHVQDAFYSDAMRAHGVDVNSFVFVAVEKTPPYLVGVYVLDHESREIGRDQYLRDLNTYRECKESGVWPGLSQKIEVLTLPAWAKLREI